MQSSWKQALSKHIYQNRNVGSHHRRDRKYIYVKKTDRHSLTHTINTHFCVCVSDRMWSCQNGSFHFVFKCHLSCNEWHTNVEPNILWNDTVIHTYPKQKHTLPRENERKKNIQRLVNRQYQPQCWMGAVLLESICWIEEQIMYCCYCLLLLWRKSFCHRSYNYTMFLKWDITYNKNDLLYFSLQRE